MVRILDGDTVISAQLQPVYLMCRSQSKLLQNMVFLVIAHTRPFCVVSFSIHENRVVMRDADPLEIPHRQDEQAHRHCRYPDKNECPCL